LEAREEFEKSKPNDFVNHPGKNGAMNFLMEDTFIDIEPYETTAIDSMEPGDYVCCALMLGFTNEGTARPPVKTSFHGSFENC